MRRKRRIAKGFMSVVGDAQSWASEIGVKRLTCKRKIIRRQTIRRAIRQTIRQISLDKILDERKISSTGRS